MIPSRLTDRRAQFAQALVFLMPALALTTPFGVTLVQVVMLAAVAWSVNKGGLTVFRGHFRTLAWVIAGFAGYFLVSLVRMLAQGGDAGMLDGPSRFLFALPCIGFVMWYRPKVGWFWAGLCAGAIAVGVFALVQRLGYGMARVEGYTHHPISFGDLALALGLMAFCSASHWRNTRWRFLPLLALAATLLASLLSGSRGGWLALAVVAAPLARYRHALSRRLVLYGGALSVLLVLAAFLVPSTRVAERLALVVSEAASYFLAGDFTTSIGIRLELWKASWMMFLDHPLAGVGRDNFTAALHALAAQGRIAASPALGYGSSHNDALYFLATGGLLDFACLLLLYGGPLRLYLAVLKEREGPGGTRAHPMPVAIAGVLLVLAFMAFGLTDVMFWLMAPTEFYAAMSAVLIGYCLGARPPAGSEANEGMQAWRAHPARARTEYERQP